MLIMFVLFSCYDLASLGQLAGDLKIEVAIVQIIMFRPKPAQFERRKSAAKPLVLDKSLFSLISIFELKVMVKIDVVFMSFQILLTILELQLTLHKVHTVQTVRLKMKFF